MNVTEKQNWLGKKIRMTVDLFPSKRKGFLSSGKNFFFQKQFTVVYGSTLSDFLVQDYIFYKKRPDFLKTTEFSTCFISMETCDP